MWNMYVVLLGHLTNNCHLKWRVFYDKPFKIKIFWKSSFLCLPKFNLSSFVCVFAKILNKENFIVITPFKMGTSFFTVLHYFQEFSTISWYTKQRNFNYLMLSIYFIYCVHNGIFFVKFTFYSNYSTMMTNWVCNM